MILDVFICLTKVLDRFEAAVAALRRRIIHFDPGVKKNISFPMKTGYQKKHILYSYVFI